MKILKKPAHSLKIPIAIAALFVLTSGVYRHDTPIEKYLELANKEEFDCVGQIFVSSKDSWIPAEGEWQRGGSCVLIDSLHILTCAHCVVGEKKKDTIVNYNGYKVSTYVVTGKYARDPADFWFLVNNQSVKAKKILVYPDYFKTSDSNFDIALIELERVVKKAGTVFLNNVPDELNDTVTGIGYGGSGPAISTSITQLFNLKLAGQNIVDAIGGPTLNKLATKLFNDFDCPDESKGTNKMGSAVPLQLEYGVKPGDSGGPLFRRKNHRLELVGILTSTDGNLKEDFEKNGYYGQIDGWSRVAAFYNWIITNK